MHYFLTKNTEVATSDKYNDIGLDWSDKANLKLPRVMKERWPVLG